MGFKGSKYDSGLDVVEIAKRVRADIRAAVAAGELPRGLKTSLRTARFAGGSSLDVRITVAPGVQIHATDRIAFELAHPHTHCDLARHTPEATALTKALGRIVAAYNRDDSDTQSDCFNVHFYWDVDFDPDLEREDRARVETAVRGALAAAPANDRPAAPSAPTAPARDEDQDWAPGVFPVALYS